MITVAIPLYNAENYIIACIKSVLEQTYTDVEILVVDDCCTDNSLKIITSIAERNQSNIRIKIVHQEKNQGVALSRNRAIKEAAGQYIFFLDSDDQITQNCLELLYQNITENRANFAMASYAYGHEENEIIFHDAIHEYGNIKSNTELFHYKYAYTRNSLFSIYIWNILFDLDFLRKNQLLFRPHRKGEDHIFFLEMMPIVQRCIILPQVTYHYILRNNSLSNYKIRNCIPSEEITESVKRLQEEIAIVRNWKDNPYYPDIIFQQIRDAIWMLLSVMRKESLIKPSLPQESMQFLCSHPLNWKEISKFKRKRIFHWGFFFFGKLPLNFKESIIRTILKLKSK